MTPPDASIKDYMPKKDEVGKTPDRAAMESRIAIKREVVDKHKRNLDKLHQRLEEWSSQQMSGATPEEKKDVPEEKPKPKEKKPSEAEPEDPEQEQESNSDEEEKMLEKLAPADRVRYLDKQLKIVKEKQLEETKMKQFHENLEQESLKTFTDVPEEIREVFTIEATGSSLKLSWDKPDENNSQITEYNIYLSSLRLSNIGSSAFEITGGDPPGTHQFSMVDQVKGDVVQDCVYDLLDLESNTGYFVMITGVNEQGEGYKTKEPCFVRTLSSHAPCDLYVWGSNTFSEIGLSEEMVAQNSTHYHHQAKKQEQPCRFLSKPLKLDAFNKTVLQAELGNTGSIALCRDEGYPDTYIIQMG